MKRMIFSTDLARDDTVVIYFPIKLSSSSVRPSSDLGSLSLSPPSSAPPFGSFTPLSASSHVVVLPSARGSRRVTASKKLFLFLS